MANLKDIAENIKKNNLDQALNLCDLYNDINNQHIIYNFKGVIYLIKENLQLSEENFLKSLKINPKFEDAIKNLYLIYLRKKNFTNLLLYSKKLIQIDKFNHQYNYQLAYALELNNNLNEAIRYYKICINFNSEDKKKALNNIGSIYLRRNKPKISINYFLQAIELGEDRIIVNNILNCYIKLRDIQKADLYFNKAKNLDKDFIEFIFNKAEYLILKNQVNDAIDILENYKDKPKFLVILLKLYFNIGQNSKGNKLLLQFKNQIKDNPEFYNYFGIRCLNEGNFDAGWKYYEYRNSKLVDFFKDTKEWSDEELDGKSIVVFNEQGLGDTLQFSKYLIPLSKKANKITFVVQENIKNLFKKDIRNLSIETLETSKDKRYDYKIALGSLIKFFYKKKIEFKDSLIQSNKELDLKWKNKLNNSKFNVGIAWSGSFNGPNEPYRSVPLKSFQEILKLDANFYCLQNEIWDRDLEYFQKLKLNDCGKFKLDEIASIIMNLDLVITADTSILHLSSILNKETWAMLSLYPDWRWGKFNDFNPYLNLKFFNQSKFNDWSNVEDSIFLELKEKINNFKKPE